MERKIGEIFKFDGKWYQCIEDDVNDCTGCELAESCPSSKEVVLNTGYCSDILRNDGKSIILKKLEKLGEPYKLGEVLIQQYQGIIPVVLPDDLECSSIFRVLSNINVIEIIIEQNKENMETKKVFMNGDDRDYLLDRLENILHDKHCLEYKDEICNSLSKYITSNNKELKPFNLEKAKAGKLICTRDGRQAKIIYLDAKGGRPIVALVKEDEEEEVPYKYHWDGSYNCHSIPSDNDLMILSEKKEGWVNLYTYKDYDEIETGIKVYNTEKEAKEGIKNNSESSLYLDTIKITWEG